MHYMQSSTFGENYITHPAARSICDSWASCSFNSARKIMYCEPKRQATKLLMCCVFQAVFWTRISRFSGYVTYQCSRIRCLRWQLLNSSTDHRSGSYTAVVGMRVIKGLLVGSE